MFLVKEMVIWIYIEFITNFNWFSKFLLEDNISFQILIGFLQYCY